MSVFKALCCIHEHSVPTRVLILHICRVFAGAIAAGGIVKAVRVPDGKRISNSRIKPKGDVANEAVAGGQCC